MATLLSSPTSMTISAPGSSALAILAASMPAGSWAQLTASNQNSILGVGSVSGSMIHYCNKMPWNPISKKIEMLAMDHNYGSVRYAQYDAAANAFVLVTNDAGFGSSVQHGYDHNVVNPYTGDLYYRRAFTGSSALTVAKKALASAATFSTLPTINTFYQQIGIGACWWSGAFTGAGSQGCLMLFNSGDSVGNVNDGQIVAYNPLTNSWFYDRHGMAPNYSTSGSTYHSVMEYSAVKNVAVYGGGNDQPSKLWRLNADGSSTAMPGVPSGAGVGIQRGNLACDPVSGNFLLLSAGKLWELNPSGSGVWTQLTGGRTPPSAVGSPGPSNPQGVVSCSIPEMGVVVYVTQSSTTGGTFSIYKHS